MKKYLLTVIGEFKNKKMCTDIAMAITPIVDSPNLKFQHTKNVLLLHFSTEVSKDEVYDYLVGLFHGTTQSFILTEINDKVSVCLPKNVTEHLFDLENGSGEEIVMKLNMEDIRNNTEFDFEEEELDDDFVALLLSQRDNVIKSPSLDQILDKITTKGYNSLSQFEKDTLELYSKK